MAVNENTIRQADNVIKIEGILKEMALSHKESDGEKLISGYITILVEDQNGDSNEIVVNAYAKQFTKSHDENSAYKALNTFMENAVSMASLMKDDGPRLPEADAKEKASRVKCNKGNISVNDYYRPSGELVSREQFNSNYFRIVPAEGCQHTAEFDIELYFQSIRTEVKNGEETGRILIDGIVPIYGGKVIPLAFVSDGEAAEYIKDNYQIGKSGHVWGRIVSTVERKEIMQQGFGKPKKDVSVTYKRELLIDGGNEEQYDPEDDTKAFSPEAIKKAWVVRETETLPNLLQKSKEKGNKPKTGFGNAASSAPATVKDSTSRPVFKW